MRQALPGLPARWSCDLADDALWWTPGVFDIFGLDHARRLDRRDIVAMYADDSRAVLEQLRSRALEERGSFTFEARIVRGDGAERWIRVVADTHVSSGRVTHLYGTKRDISDEVSRAAAG